MDQAAKPAVPKIANEQKILFEILLICTSRITRTIAPDDSSEDVQTDGGRDDYGRGASWQELPQDRVGPTNIRNDCSKHGGWFDCVYKSRLQIANN